VLGYLFVPRDLQTGQEVALEELGDRRQAG
jgi:hypothetical protein